MISKAFIKGFKIERGLKLTAIHTRSMSMDGL